MLTTRLDTLVDPGVLERVPYEEGARPRYDYLLTDKGRALWPVLVTLRQWGDEWIVGEGNEPVLMVHTTCGHTDRPPPLRPLRRGARAARARAGPGPGPRATRAPSRRP